MNDIFDMVTDEKIPLAERMRPISLKDFVGQAKIAGEKTLLRRAISLDRLGSCIFYGPPGCGKTTLANIIANSTSGAFVKLNAVSSGVADVKKAVDDAIKLKKATGKKTYLLLDECHRFNKTQSDSLLPSIERGDIIFIGSTTENPYASMTPAIVSRCRIFKFEKLSENDIKERLIKALNDKEKGLGNYNATVEEDALNHLTWASGGDLRVAYNALELAVLTTSPDKNGKITVTKADAEQSVQRKALSVDTSLYYDILSAFCKSLRGSDANGALFYAFRLIEAGCDPILIARRLIAHSSEDVGMANSNALVVAVSALTALQNMGVPEGLIPLSHAIIYVCNSEKSNSVIKAMDGAREDAKKCFNDDVPAHLKNSVYASDKEKELSSHYLYPHDYGGYCEQQYLPNALKDRVYYVPSDNGEEKIIKRFIEKNLSFKKSGTENNAKSYEADRDEFIGSGQRYFSIDEYKEFFVIAKSVIIDKEDDAKLFDYLKNNEAIKEKITNVCKLFIEKDRVSCSAVQRCLNMGYVMAIKIVDWFEEIGIVTYDDDLKIKKVDYKQLWKLNRFLDIK